MALLKSFQNAFDGIIYAARTQRNMRTHLAIAAIVLIAVVLLRLDRFYVVATVVLVALVLGLELLNTAIETIVDMLTADHHPMAKVAKDAAAGAVLVAALAAVAVGYLVFYQGLTSGSARVYEAVQAVPVNLVAIVLAVAAIATIFAKAWTGRGSALRGGSISGHAALAFAAATLLSLFYQRPLAALLGYFMAFLVAQSRVESKVHSVFEVLWGGVLGTLAALVLYLLVRPHVVP